MWYLRKSISKCNKICKRQISVSRFYFHLFFDVQIYLRQCRYTPRCFYSDKRTRYRTLIPSPDIGILIGYWYRVSLREDHTKYSVHFAFISLADRNIGRLFRSEENLDCLTRGSSSLQTPFLAMRPQGNVCRYSWLIIEIERGSVRNVSILPHVSGGNPGYGERQRHFTSIHKITPKRREGGVD